MVVAVMALFLPSLTTTIDGLGNDRIGGEPGNAANGGSSGMGGSARSGDNGGGAGGGRGGAEPLQPDGWQLH